MPDQKQQNRLIKTVGDRKLIDFFYLEYSLEALAQKLAQLSFTLSPKDPRVPFNAQLRNYVGAVDEDDHFWIVKKVKPEEAFFHRLGELAYLIDFALQTLSAPTLLIKIQDQFYRATKRIEKCTQISGYNYLAEPLRRVVANDLINRWLLFDEDRNPNNYLVIHNSKGEPLIVAIDFNHADLEAEHMKITGDEEKFGWHRAEKTRFLTLLKPANFEKYSIQDFERRLGLMMNLPEKTLKQVAQSLFKDVVKDPAGKADLIAANILRRREHINNYFRKWLPQRDQKSIDREYNQYEGLGKTFVDIYKKKI